MRTSSLVCVLHILFHARPNSAPRATHQTATKLLLDFQSSVLFPTRMGELTDTAQQQKKWFPQETRVLISHRKTKSLTVLFSGNSCLLSADFSIIEDETS